MNLKILSFFILSTIIFSSEHFRKCGTFSNNTSRAFPRPVLSNEGQPYVSPSGYFMIHYNISGQQFHRQLINLCLSHLDSSNYRHQEEFLCFYMDIGVKQLK